MSDRRWTFMILGCTMTGVPAPHVAIAVAVAAAWGLNFVVIEVGLRDLPPLVLCALRFALAALPAFVIARPAVAWRVLIAIGLSLGVVKFGLLFTGMDVGMTAGLASLVLQSQALFTVVLAALVLGEHPGRRQIAGLAVAATGMAIIGVARGGGITVTGLAMVLGAGAAWSVANLLMRRAGADPLALMVWISLIPPLPLLVLATVVDGPGTVADSIAGIDLAAAGAVLYIAAVATLGGFAGWSWLLRRHPAGQVASFGLLVPPFGIGFGALLLGEPLSAAHGIAAVLTLAGIALVVRPAKPRDPVATPAPAPA